MGLRLLTVHKLCMLFFLLLPWLKEDEYRDWETSTSYDLDTTPAHILRKKIAMNDLIERCESSDTYYARLIADLIADVS